MSDLKEIGAKELQKLPTEFRHYLHDFLETYLWDPQHKSAWKDLLRNGDEFLPKEIPVLHDQGLGTKIPDMSSERGVPRLIENATSRIAGIVRKPGLGLLDVPTQVAIGSTSAYFGFMSPEEWGVAAALALSNDELNREYTCKQRIWDPELNQWVWHYNYTLIELESSGNPRPNSGISQRGISRAFIDYLIDKGAQLSADKIDILLKVEPTYRLVCRLSSASPSVA